MECEVEVNVKVYPGGRPFVRSVPFSRVVHLLWQDEKIVYRWAAGKAKFSIPSLPFCDIAFVSDSRIFTSEGPSQT